MSAITSTEKRRRAAGFPVMPGPTPTGGSLDVTWESPFDRSCYLVSAPDMAKKHKKPYDQLMKDLLEATGCTEDEIIAHGNKVRALLFFAEDRLARTGELAHLTGKQKQPYDLPTVSPAF